MISSMQRRSDIPIETTFACSYSDGPAIKTLTKLDEYIKECVTLKSQILTLESERDMLLIQTKQMMTDRAALSFILNNMRHFASLNAEKKQTIKANIMKEGKNTMRRSNSSLMGLSIPYSIKRGDTVSETDPIKLLFSIDTGSVIKYARFSHDGEKLSFSDGRTLFVLSAINGNLIHQIDIGNLTSFSGPVAFSGDDSLIATSTDDNSVVIVSLADKKVVARLAGHIREVSQIIFLKDENSIMTVGYDGRLCCWDAGNYSLTKTIQHGKIHDDDPHNLYGAISGISTSPDGSFVIISFLRGFIGMYDTKLEYQMTKTVTKHGYTNGIYVCGGDNSILTANYDSTACKWSTKGNLKCIQTYKGHTDSVLSVVSSFSGEFTYTGSKDETICIWKSTNERPLCIIQAHKNSVLDLDISPSDKSLVSVGGDGIICVWDVSVKQ